MTDCRAIFVTGAASGIGAATARLFASRGWLVGAADVDERGLAALAGELGTSVRSRRLDVTDALDFGAALREFGAAAGERLDVFFNNAGVGESGWFEDIPLAAALRVVQVNFVGVLHGIYAALPLLRRTPNSLCFNTSSSSATFGVPRLAVYSATKYAVKGLTEALSVEFARHGVRVADTLPGIIDTPLLDGTPNRSPDAPRILPSAERAASEGPYRLLAPDAVAQCVWDAYHSDGERLHWYVPEEVAEIERAAGESAEKVRDFFRQMVLPV
jgi:NAD(P)-dependent dehydrogenase (short-subunit alcohol dehydrogenase family)